MKKKKKGVFVDLFCNYSIGLKLDLKEPVWLYQFHLRANVETGFISEPKESNKTFEELRFTFESNALLNRSLKSFLHKKIRENSPQKAELQIDFNFKNTMEILHHFSSWIEKLVPIFLIIPSVFNASQR